MFVFCVIVSFSSFLGGCTIIPVQSTNGERLCSVGVGGSTKVLRTARERAIGVGIRALCDSVIEWRLGLLHVLQVIM